MTRKLLSGVLAFAMVFGCTAPVALAEDTTVEEVEQYAVYAPSLGASSVTLNKAGDTATVTVTGVAADATVTITANSGSKYTGVIKDGKLTITAGGVVTDGDELTISFLSLDANGQKDEYINDVTLTVEKGATTYDYVDVNDDELDDIDSPVRVGQKASIIYYGQVKEDDGDGDKTDDKVVGWGAPTVTAELNENAKKFYTLSVKEYTDPTTKKVTGTVLTVTAVKAMTVDEIANMYLGGNEPAIRLSIKFGTVSIPSGKVPLPAVLASDEKAPLSVSLSANATTTVINNETNPVKLAATVLVDDGFGGTIADNYADVNWYVNGIKMEFTGDTATYRDTLDTEDLATLELVRSDGNKITAVTFVAKKAGAYKITVETADGNCMANRTITATNPTLTPGNSIHVAKSNDWNADDATGGIKVTTPGTTVDLSGIRFAARESAAPNKGYAIADFGIKVTGYEVLNATVDGKVIASKAIAAKAVTVDKNGLVTVADDTNTVMKELLTQANGKDIVFNIGVTFKDTDGYEGYKLWSEGTPVQVVVATPSKTAAKMDLYLDGKKVDTSKPVVLNVGETYDFDVKVMDSHDYADAVDQRVVWQITDTDEKNVYATVDQNGVVTPLLASIKLAKLQVVSIANTTVDKSVDLIIIGEAEKPTTAPTAAPTAAPELKGTVNTSSSALNIRAAASTTAGVVTKAAKGSTVTILGEENGFYKVKLADGTIGYASKAYIKVVTDTPVETATATTTANLKLRTSAPSGSVITTMPKGSTVTVLEKGASWSKVEYNGKVGYASNSYLTFNTVG